MSPHSPVRDTSEQRAWRPRWTWTPEGLVAGEVVAVDGAGVIVPYAGGPVEDRAGILLPGLVNAHTHLELGAFPFVRGTGILPWVKQLRLTTVASGICAGAGAMAAVKAGTAAVGEISNTGLSSPVLSAAHVPARAWREVFGIDLVEVPDFPTLTPHAPHTTHPSIILAAARNGTPWSIHFDEDPEESAFLHGRGEWVPFTISVGRDLSRFDTPHLSPAAYLAALGVLSPLTLLVHATCTRADDLDVIAASGAHVCLCVRSNEAITGRTPDVHGMLHRGIPVAIGTDSLASAPDLDPLAEAAALRRVYPKVAPATWLRALTEGGADALHLPLGRILAGQAPGLLLVDIPETTTPLDTLFDGTRWRRRWLACPQVS